MSKYPNRRTFLKAGVALAAAVASPRGWAADDNPSETLYRDAIVIDGNLVPPFDDQGPLDQTTASEVRSSGITALKMTIGGSGGTFAEAEADIAECEKALARSSDVYVRILKTPDILAAKKARKVGIIFSFESAEMLEDKPERIDHFSAQGVRVMQLGYNNVSPFASGVLAPQPSQGLTELGREAVARMNAQGVTLDLSHADAKSTLDAIAASSKPVLITHAGCTAVHPHLRNKTDAVLRALAEKGGVIGIYELCFLSAGPAQSSIADYLAHITHALNICGENHVGIGSDARLGAFDTSPAAMTEWNKQIAARKAAGVAAPGEGRPPFVEGLNRSDRARVIAGAMLQHGIAPRVVEKVLGTNFLRVFRETWPA